MKKLLLAGIMLTLVPLISFAQTTAPGTTATMTTPAVTVDPGLAPGDFFYFLDNWGENLRLTFTFNKESKAKLHLQYAKERVAEMKDVLKKPDAKLEDIASAKRNFDTQVADAATLVKSEKDNGSDVAGLARELSDELDQSRVDLKDIFQGHQGKEGRAEAEIRAKINEITISGTASSTGAKEMKGLTQALESITKEKNNTNKEENNLDAGLSGEQALFDEVMGTEMAAQKHIDRAIQMSMEGAMRFRDGLGNEIPAGVADKSGKLLDDAQAAMKRGDFESAKRISKDAEKGLENVKMMRTDGEMNMQGMGVPNASGTEMNTEDGIDVGAGHLDNLESGIKEGERMMDNLNR